MMGEIQRKPDPPSMLNANLSMVRSKGGIMPLQPSVPMGPGPGTAWARDPNAKITVWTQRAKN